MTSSINPDIPKAKPVATLTKKGYSNVCDYITDNTDPETATVMVNLLKEALRNITGFDPDAKIDPEKQKKEAIARKKRLEREGTTAYEKYMKPWYEKLKADNPGVPPSQLINKNRA